MNNAKASLKVLLFFLLFFLSAKINAQISGFSLSAPTTPIGLGTPFQVGVSYAVGPNTTNDTVRITYNPQLVTYDPGSTFLPSNCLTVINNSPVLMIIGDNCKQIGTIALGVGFRFICPDSCTGVNKPSVFTGLMTDNLGTVVPTSTVTATGILNSQLAANHTFSSYNSVTNRITYSVSYSNPTCFKINGARFNLALVPAAPVMNVVSVSGSFTFNQALSAIVPNTGIINPTTSGSFQYVVQLPCDTDAGDVFSSTLNVTGTNCGTLNAALVTTPAVTYTIPANPPNFSPISVSSAGTATFFRQTITNVSPSPVSLEINSYLPAVHLTGISQTTNQASVSNNVTNFNCTTGQTNFTLTGNASNNGVPANTRRVRMVINNLQPGSYIQVDKLYDLASSCNGPAGTPPFRDTTIISYRCLPNVNVCDTCGPGTSTSFATFNPLPLINCNATTTMPVCREVGDTITLSYSFRNIGTATLANPVYTVNLPAWLQALPATANYTGFPATPAITNTGNIQFALPNLPVSNTQVYTISFQAIIQPGAVSGTPQFNNTMTGNNGNYNVTVCQTTLRICAISSLDIVKRVKGSANSSFASTGTGAPDTDVEYQVTLFNSGTTVINAPVVIDRVPRPGNLTIMGNPTVSQPILNQFAMQMLPVPASADYVTAYNTVQNLCTGWNSTGTNCNAPAAWTSSPTNAAAVRFTFSPSFLIMPGASYTFTYKMHIPAGLANGLQACNTAGILPQVLDGPPLFATESNSACITVSNPCGATPSPAFTTTNSCANNVFTVTANSTAASPAQHEWSLMQMTSCSGGTGNGNTAGQVGNTQTTQNASFVIPAGTTCYYIKHRIFLPGCYDTTVRVQLNIPLASIAFTMQDNLGNIKNTFCSGEEVIFNGTASTGETQYNVEIRRRPTGIGTFVPWANVGPFSGQATTLNLSQLLLSQNKFFEPGFDYGIYFTISNPANCMTLVSKDAITIECCEDFFNAGFQLQVNPAAGSYTITSVLFNTYATANATHEWYVLSSPNAVGGPYTPVYSSTATTLVWPGAQYNLYYTVVHKVITPCGEVCSSRSQWQTNNRGESEEVDGCCLAAFYWANGAGNPPAPMSADFDISINTSGNTQYTISVSPTNTYSNLSGVTHEWYLWSSPNPTGGPYTPVSQGNYPNFAYNGAYDGLYYFIVHKVITPCGEVCFTQDVCRNCGEKKACDIKWPDCYPPSNLRNDCRRGRLTWDPVTAAGAYEIQLYYNNAECCRSEYLPAVKEYTLDGNVFALGNYDHPKHTCFSWRVRAKCDKGYSEWSSWSCFYCPEPEGPVILGKDKNAGNNNGVKMQPEITRQVFPNPNDGSMFLRMKASGELVLSVEVFNATGVLVKSIAESKHPDGNYTKSLQLGNRVAKGLYFVVFKTNFGTYTEKVLVQ